MRGRSLHCSEDSVLLTVNRLEYPLEADNSSDELVLTSNHKRRSCQSLLILLWYIST